MERVSHDDLCPLIARARDGDEVALERLLDMHARRLLESIRAELGQRLRQRLESQDVMQQVYLDVLRHIGEFEDRGRDSFFAWLRQIALNRICDADRRAFRTAKRGAEVRAADVGGNASMTRLIDALNATGTTPSGVADQAERVRRLHDALERLSPDQRRVIELRYLEQLSVAEAAARMERSERAVRSLCVRALIRLRELLGDAISESRTTR